MKFIDTHTHPYDEAFDSDRVESLQRAIENGVDRWILPAIDRSSFKSQIECYNLFPENSFMAMGLHPTSVGESWKEELDFVSDMLSENHNANSPYRFVAVGEVGLDAYWSRDFMKEQAEVFSAQVDMAIKYDLPLIIHVRSALVEIFDILDSKPHILRGIFHAFGGSYETYKRTKKYGDFKVGIGGVVTFKNAHVAESIEDIPLDEIVLETDSPWLTPAPYRGKRNESSYIPLIAQKIATIKGIDINDVARVTTATAEKIFSL